MKSILLICFLFLQFFCACTNEERDRSDPTITSENDADAARNFIRSVLDGKLDNARNMLAEDSLNRQLFDAYERIYKNRTNPQDKRGYRESSITIYSVRPLNDSTSVISYSNSYKKRVDSLKVMRENGEWKVDLKYSLTPADK